MRKLTVLIICTLILIACRSEAASPGAGPASEPAVSMPSSAGPDDFGYVFDAPSDPIQIQITLDPSASTEANLPVDGGALSVTGADGTRYSLEIPGDALLNETAIRMTAVASVSGLPFGEGQTHAVHLEPEGLFLNNFATLTIEPAQEIPVDQQIFFGYEGDGQGLTLAPPFLDAAEIKIQLLHFSGYGVTKGLLADTEPWRARLGGDAEKRLASLAAEHLGAERQRALLGAEASDDLGDWFQDLDRQYMEQVVKPRLAAAGQSCAAGRLALQTFLSWERQRQLLGMGEEGGFGTEIADLMKTVAKVCVQEEYELCVEEHIIHRMINVWLGLERQYALLGVDSDGARSPELEEAKALTAKCLSFELVFESNGNFDDGGGGGYESIVKAKVPMRFDPEALKITGQSALVSEFFEFRDGDPYCTVDSRRGGATFDGSSLAYIPDTRSPTDELGYVRDFKLTYWPGVTTESFTIFCEDEPPLESPPNGYWTGLFLMLHFPELTGSSSAAAPNPMASMGALMGGMGMDGPLPAFPVPNIQPGEGYVAEDWEIFGDEYFAKKEWIKGEAGLGLTEAGTLKLYHRPGS